MNIVSFDGHLLNSDTLKANFVKDYGLPQLEATVTERYQAAPVITGVKYTDYMLPPLQLEVANPDESETTRTARVNLHQWFDGKDGRSRPLIITDDDGGRERYINALPLVLIQNDGAGGYHFVSMLKPDGSDPHHRWRATTDDTEEQTLTASGQTIIIDNEGDDDAYPILEITPTTPRSSGYTYKRWSPIIWRNETGAAQYPIEITGGGLNTAALVTAGKMRSDGNDIKVEVDGSQVNRWLGGMNTSATKIWVALSFQYIAPVTLVDALDDGDVDSIEVVGDISGYPASGILMIGSEAIQYTSRSSNQSQFVGITRGAHGTTAASHTTADQIWLVQHSVYLIYGNPASTTYTQPQSTQEPIIDLAGSTNQVWVFDLFGDSNVARMGAWETFVAAGYNAYAYTNGGDVSKAIVSPWAYLGIGYTTMSNIVSASTVMFSHDCGIDSVQIVTGEMYVADEVEAWGWALTHYGWVGGQSQIAKTTSLPATRNSVIGWAETVSLTGLTGLPTRYSFELLLRGTPGAGFKTFVGMNQTAVTLHSANTPVATLGAEVSNYPIQAIIRNETTGHELTVEFSMSIGETLRIDTDQKLVTYLKDNSQQGQAVATRGLPRQFWLPLQVGVNTLRFTDAGMGNVEITISYRKRYYF